MNENKNTDAIIAEGDKFLILLDEILELISEWKKNYVPPVEKEIVPDVEKEIVPDVLDFEPGDTVYYMTSFGEADDYLYCDYPEEEKTQKTHRVFETPEMLEMYRDKTHVIADMLHFKQIYDSDFEPDFSNHKSEKYVLLKDIHDNQYIVAQTGMLYSEESVYFSTCEIAQKCADWLNEKRKCENE